MGHGKYKHEYLVRFYILTAVNLRVNIFWDVKLYFLLGGYQTYLYFEDGGNTFLRNVVKFLPD
jgi:hypothetical protein